MSKSRWWLLLYWIPVLWTLYVLLVVVGVELFERVGFGQNLSLYRLAARISLVPLAAGIAGWAYLLAATLRRRETGWFVGILLCSLVAMPLYGRHRHWERP